MNTIEANETAQTQHREFLIKQRLKSFISPAWRVAQERFEQRIGAAEAASLREILLGIAADAELVRPIPSRPAS